jgi:hypothetical protein
MRCNAGFGPLGTIGGVASDVIDDRTERRWPVTTTGVSLRRYQCSLPPQFGATHLPR